MTCDDALVARRPGARIVTVVQQSPDVPLGLLAGWLAGTDLRMVRAYAGDEVPASAADVPGGLIVLGGPMSVCDAADAPWLPATRALLADAAATGVPTLAICLGAQLLAVARGGQVQVAAPPGVEAGVIDVHWRPEAVTDRLVGGLLDLSVSEDHRTTAMPSQHGDAVVELPPGAVWLAWSETYPYQAFRTGSAWGLQFHPEADADLLALFAADDERLDPDALHAEASARADELHASGRMIANAFLTLLDDRASEAAAA